MTMLTGFDAKKYWKDTAYWQGNQVDDLVVLVNNTAVEDLEFDALADTDKVKFSEGWVMSPSGKPICSIARHAKRWLQAQGTCTLLVQIPQEHLDQFVHMVSTVEDWKILK